MHVVMRDERTVLVKCRHEYESWLVVFIRQFFLGGGCEYIINRLHPRLQPVFGYTVLGTRVI